MNATLNLLLTIVFQNNCYMFKLMQIKTELNNHLFIYFIYFVWKLFTVLQNSLVEFCNRLYYI